ncbi:MAG: alanine:cation symporter family protein [Treponema sp.]|jgi:AGCS family alanine or glycine:cation symporter|nr:alanine:cation symporter family protein [Treponema sp.]
MEAFTAAVSSLGFFLWAYVFGIALIAGGIYFTIRTRFVQFTTLRDAFRTIGGKDKAANLEAAGKDKPKTALSAFQAFCVSESSRVGTGNVVGVAVAIAMGGPGSIFWMWVMAIIGAATGFVESTLSQVYKENHKDRFMGGAMYYFQRAFKSKVPSYVHAGILAFTYVFVFNSVQTNTIADTFQGFVPNRLFIGIAVSAVIMFIIFGGIKRVSKVASVMMPPIIISYLLVCFGIVLVHFPQFIQAMGYIVSSAFGTVEVAGGVLGFTFAQALQHGLRRGLFSNEAGIGSVPIGASTSNVSHPVKQGAVQSFGVLLDTLIICSATAFIILMSGNYLEGTTATGVALVRDSLAYWIGPLAVPFLNVMLFLLPFTSLIGNYFYGETCFRFIAKNQTAVNVFKILGGVTIIIASVVPLQLVWSMADIFTGTLATMNIIALFVLCGIAVKCLDNYKKQIKDFRVGTGKDPVFYDDEVGIDTPYWKRGR